MENHSPEVPLSAQCLFQHIRGLPEIRASREAVSDDGAAEEVQHRRQVGLSPGKMEFGHVRDPLFIWPVGPELAVKQIGRHLSDSPPVGTVLRSGNPGKEAKFLHDSLLALVVHDAVFLPESRRDATVSVSASAFGEKRLYCRGKLHVFIAWHVFHVVFVGGLGHMCQAQKQLQRESVLALEDALYCEGFFPLSRSALASTKDFSFFRYAFSALR